MAQTIGAAPSPKLASPSSSSRPRIDASIIAIFMAGVCTFIDVYSTQSLLPELGRVFHATALHVALTISATTLAVAVVAPLVGFAAERIERKRLIASAMLVLAAPTAMAATSTSLNVLIGWRLLQGVCIPGIIAVIMAYISEEWPADSVGFAMGSYASGTVLGGFVGRFVTGVVAEYVHWRASFVALAIITTIGGLIVWRWLPPSRNFVRAQSTRASLRSGAAHLRNPQVLATFGVGFALLFTLLGTATYTNFYLAAPPFGLNSAQLGTVFCIYLVGIVMTPIAGRYMDLHGYRSTIVLATVGTLIGLVLTLKLWLPLVLLGMGLVTGGMFVTQGITTAHLGLVAGEGRASAAGLYVSFYYIGGSFGAAVPGLFWMRGGWPATAALLAASTLATLFLGFVASRKSKLLPL